MHACARLVVVGVVNHISIVKDKTAVKKEEEESMHGMHANVLDLS